MTTFLANFEISNWQFRHGETCISHKKKRTDKKNKKTGAVSGPDVFVAPNKCNNEQFHRFDKNLVNSFTDSIHMQKNCFCSQQRWPQLKGAK